MLKMYVKEFGKSISILPLILEKKTVSK